jgi:hypothetical protein
MKHFSKIVVGITFSILMLSSAVRSQGDSDEVYGMSDRELLPPGSSAWVIHLFTIGGVDGKGLPAVTAVSDGSYACGDIVPENFQKLTDQHLKTISDAVLPAVFKPDKTMTPGDPLPPYCKDCYIVSLVVTRRESDNKVRTYSESEKLLRYSRIAETFEKVKGTVKKLDLCPK